MDVMHLMTGIYCKCGKSEALSVTDYMFFFKNYSFAI